MAKKYFTIEEIQSMKFYELPNVIYNVILAELTKQFGVMIDRLLPILNNARLIDIEQFCDIYKYIKVI